jgi:hypothetical protein
MPTDPAPVSVFDVVRRSVDAVDPDRADERLADLLERFEDDDEPVRGVDQLDEVLADAELDLDVNGDDPDIALALATVRYLAHHRAAIRSDDDTLMREAVRWQWHGHPPAALQVALDDRGVEY